MRSQPYRVYAYDVKAAIVAAKNPKLFPELDCSKTCAYTCSPDYSLNHEVIGRPISTYCISATTPVDLG
jgi:hypothetical protein